MSVEVTLMVLSSLVICSYLFDLIARRFRIPSVILLLLSGMGISYLVDLTGLPRLHFTHVLPIIGTVGLILIVLEGALELKLHREKIGLVKQTLAAAFFILLLTTAGIAALFYFLTGEGIRLCVLNAVPLGVISSAIAIPSAGILPADRKEFIIYESSFSDIFGIILFNFMVSHDEITALSFVELGWSTLIILILAGVFCLILMFLLKRITHHLKFFLIIAMLILAYAVGKFYHLPTLVMVLAFGLFLNNIHWIRFRWFTRNFKYDNFYKDFHQLAQLSGESAFVVRTFFFLIFGFTLDVNALLQMDVVIAGLLTLAAIYIVRIVYMRIVVRTASWAEYLLAPRGLISILLFFSIPEAQRLSGINSGLLFFVILGTSVMMAMGFLTIKGGQPIASEE